MFFCIKITLFRTIIRFFQLDKILNLKYLRLHNLNYTYYQFYTLTCFLSKQETNNICIHNNFN